eukprot:5801925-Amphidinium_carterae.2
MKALHLTWGFGMPPALLPRTTQACSMPSPRDYGLLHACDFARTMIRDRLKSQLLLARNPDLRATPFERTHCIVSEALQHTVSGSALWRLI